MSCRRRLSPSLVLLTACWLSFSSIAAASDEPPLFSVIGKKVFTIAPDDPGVVRRQPIEVNWQTLTTVNESFQKSAQSSSVQLPLFEGRSLELAVDSIEPTLDGWALVAEQGRAVLVWGRGHLFGSIHDDQTTYRVQSTPEGPVLDEVDVSAYPIGQDDAVLPPRRNDSAESQLSPRELEPKLSSGKDSGNEIDLMVVYTGRARSRQGGASAIRQLIQLGVTETNIAMARSGVGVRMRLVHMEEVAYSESGKSIDHLNRLTRPSDGVMDQVHALRDQYGADMVKLVGATFDPSCGVAWLLTSPNDRFFESLAFSYTAAACISPGYTFAHELGHNLGCRHAPVDPGGDRSGAYSFSKGYKDPGRAFRTIMAYNCENGGCRRELRWSTPRLRFNGKPLGTAGQDNARTINGVRNHVANFRQRRADPGQLSWTAAETSVAEHESSVRLNVNRAGGSSGTVAVNWRVESVTAQVGLDIENASGSVAWDSGQTGDRQVIIPILNDQLIEGDEQFRVILSDATSGAQIEGSGTALVTLLDNDVMPFQCTNDAQRTCLAQGRFEVSVTWRNSQDQRGVGQSVELDGQSGNRDSALLWFFQEENWEMLFKVLDGCAQNDHFWVFFAATTDVEYELRVVDSLTGEFRIYRNPLGTASASINDTGTFSCS